MCEHRNNENLENIVTTIPESVKPFSYLCLGKKKLKNYFLEVKCNLGYYVTLNNDHVFLYTYSSLPRQSKVVFLLLDELARKNVMHTFYNLRFPSHFGTAASHNMLVNSRMRWDDKTAYKTITG